MALNPFFLQGSPSEQRLVQDLINEQLGIYGVEVTYIPRKFVNRQTIIEEVQQAKFDDNFSIEAYVNTYEGYGGQGDIMTKFGMSLRDELTLTISRERFEDFIGAFLTALPDDEIIVDTRPREGDLVYFPLGQRLFEIKFVEHEEPFYQLGKNYVYQLKCELFEYEGEVIDTSIDAIDTQVQDEGFITTLNMVSAGTTAAATAVLSQPTGYVRELFLTNDGSGYTTTPTVAISTAPGATGVSATAVAITTTRAGVKSIERIVLTNAGSGYTSPPTITIIGGNGTGAIATCSIETTQKGVISYTVTNQGGGYSAVPTITVAGPTGSGTTSTAEAVINADKQVTSVRVTNPGIGYTQVPAVSFSAPAAVGVGTFYYNEVIRGQTSLTEARVRSWDVDTKILKVANVGIGTTISGFIPGETIIGTGSTIAGEYAAYTLGSHDNRDIYDEYDSNDEIESEADSMIDFTESNPFGQF
ncbi:MAG: hypothetical protein CM15mV9_1020 [uncultured marine virus]|nr:MAG: hypothetical protein CM15mV9_1020 [uncultured marine virus]